MLDDEFYSNPTGDFITDTVEEVAFFYRKTVIEIEVLSTTELLRTFYKIKKYRKDKKKVEEGGEV